MLDRNKTPLTHRATATTAAYFDGLGCKPVETEVQVSPGWLADVASFWYPTRTEAKKLRLSDKAAAMLLDESDHEDADLFYFGGGPLTVLAEVKTTRADFLSDQKWRVATPPANLCFLACPQGVAEDSEVPAGWWSIVLSKEGTKIIRVNRKLGSVFAQHQGQLLDFIAAVAIRRDHRSRYRAIKDWARTYRAKDSERRCEYRARRILESLVQWLRGNGYKPERSLLEILPELGIKQVPSYLKDSIVYLEDLRVREMPR